MARAHTGIDDTDFFRFQGSIFLPDLCKLRLHLRLLLGFVQIVLPLRFQGIVRMAFQPQATKTVLDHVTDDPVRCEKLSSCRDFLFSDPTFLRKHGCFRLNVVKLIEPADDLNLISPILLRNGRDHLLDHAAFGRPYFTSAYMPEAAAGEKTVIFGDLNYYWIGDRQGITFKRLNELFAGNGQVGFLASKRLDGKTVLPEAIKVLQMKGTAQSGS